MSLIHVLSYTPPPNRDGGVHEAGGGDGCGADGRGEEPAIGGIQERDRSAASILEDNQQHRTEGGEQGRGRQAQDDSGIQENGNAAPSVLSVFVPLITC